MKVYFHFHLSHALPRKDIDIIWLLYSEVIFYQNWNIYVHIDMWCQSLSNINGMKIHAERNP